MAINLAVMTDATVILNVAQQEPIGLVAESSISINNAPNYDGPYEVTPKAWDEQILATDGKLMTDDVTVFRVPYYETVNLFDGKTAYIAEEV